MQYSDYILDEGIKDTFHKVRRKLGIKTKSEKEKDENDRKKREEKEAQAQAKEKAEQRAKELTKEYKPKIEKLIKEIKNIVSKSEFGWVNPFPDHFIERMAKAKCGVGYKDDYFMSIEISVNKDTKGKDSNKPSQENINALINELYHLLPKIKNDIFVKNIWFHEPCINFMFCVK